MFYRRRFTAIAFSGFVFSYWLPLLAKAQTPYKPTDSQLLAGFERANTLQDKAANSVFMVQLVPHWFGSHQLWYRVNKPGGVSSFIKVNTDTGQKSLLFDEKDVANGLEKAGYPLYEAGKVPIRQVEVLEGGNKILIRIGGKNFLYDVASRSLNFTETRFQSPGKSLPKGGRPQFMGTDRELPSPNGLFKTRLEGGNVEVEDQSGQWVTVTKEGHFKYLQWGGDSRHLIAWYCIAGDRKVLYLLHSTGAGKTRATLETRRYDQPGDKLDTYIPYVIDAKNLTERKVDTEPMMNGSYPWPSAPSVRWWNHGFLIDYPIRGYQEYKVDYIDPTSAAIRNVIDEKSQTFVDLGKISLQPIPGSTDLLWNSERDGWARLYRIDGLTGKVLNAVTPTHGVFRHIVWLDAKNGVVYYTGNDYPECVDQGQNPYLLHLYRTDLDGKNVIDLTPQNGTHSIAFSPDHKVFVDTYSWVNKAPIHNLVSASDGKVLAHLASANIKGLLRNNVRLPIPFEAKGRDGKTNIWGIVCLPSNFNPKMKYPVIENIYAGPQSSFVPTRFYPFLYMSRLAELGFIVVQIDGMGTDNRSRAFHDVCWHNIDDSGFSDRILWMQALAKKMPQVDLNRVGVYGTSAGGQDAVNALLLHPEFYKVGVASCGCYDNRIDKQWWNEQWMGYPVGPWYREQACATNAAKLKGHLLLMDAEDDHNVPPESSIRLASALIKAGKTFSYMIFPASDHTDGGVFGERKRRDFFVQWLFGMNPPNWNDLPSKS